MSIKISFKGAVTEIITPFNGDGTLNEELLRKEVDYQVESGIAGLFSNGLASESALMTLEEKSDITKIVHDQAKGAVPLLANITGNTLPECLKLLALYEDAKAEAISLTQPMTYGFTQDGLYTHLATIADATKLPVCIYNAPQTGNVLTPETVAKLLNNHENIVYYKESTIDIIHIQNTMRLINAEKEYEFLAGSDATTLPIGMLGGKGIISLISAVFPKPVIKLCQEIERGDMEAAKKTQFEILQIRDALKIGPFIAGYKYAAELIGVPMGEVRKPLTKLSNAEKEKIKANLSKLNLI